MFKPTTRRRFLEGTAAAAVAGSFASGVHAGGSDLLKIGLIGCGGRGTGAATQALKADNNFWFTRSKLWAMADAFQDRLQASHARLTRDPHVAAYVDVPPARQFVGFDAYRRVIAECDVVLLCTPPHFRPAHLRAAVEANRHVFAEKPVAVDAPGVRAVLATCAEARKRNLSVVSGLCLRYSTHYREVIRRIHDGAIGDIRCLQANDLRGRIWMFPREKNWSDMEWQMRNWYYFTWLSGDFNVEQHVHNLDVCAWALRDEYPAKCVGMGGRQVRVGTEYGNIYDHFAVVYEYQNGVKVFSNTRQQANCRGDITVYAHGTTGRAVICERQRDMGITGPNAWRPNAGDNDFYQAEHNDLFASIRNSRPINNGDYMTKSTLMAIMARMAAYTGREITWEQAMNSKEDLTPARYEWGRMPMPAVAMPGVTRFV
jgi:myo-inositol 2-dehydrogenase / D-chiro-inositol 1-dehydrogenase